MDYVRHLGINGWIVIGGVVVGAAIPLALFVWALANAPMPDGASPWVWLTLTIAVMALLIPPFFAFKSIGMQYIKRLRELQKEYARIDESWRVKFSDVEEKAKLNVGVAERYATEQTSRAVHAEERLDRLQSELGVTRTPRAGDVSGARS